MSARSVPSIKQFVSSANKIDVRRVDTLHKSLTYSRNGSVPMFPGTYVPRYLCSPIFRLIFLSLQIVMNIHAVIFAHERTKSSANSIAQDVLVLAFSAKTSMIIMKRSELSTYSWCNPTFTSKYSVLPHLLFTL